MVGGRGSWGLGHPTAATAPSASRGLGTSRKANTGKREQHSERGRGEGQSRGREVAVVTQSNDSGGVHSPESCWSEQGSEGPGTHLCAGGG